MKGIMSIVILLMALFMVIPMFLLIFEHMLEGKDSILQKLLNNITEV